MTQRDLRTGRLAYTYANDPSIPESLANTGFVATSRPVGDHHDLGCRSEGPCQLGQLDGVEWDVRCVGGVQFRPTVSAERTRIRLVRQVAPAIPPAY